MKIRALAPENCLTVEQLAAVHGTDAAVQDAWNEIAAQLRYDSGLLVAAGHVYRVGAEGTVGGLGRSRGYTVLRGDREEYTRNIWDLGAHPNDERFEENCKIIPEPFRDYDPATVSHAQSGRVINEGSVHRLFQPAALGETGSTMLEWDDKRATTFLSREALRFAPVHARGRNISRISVVSEVVRETYVGPVVWANEKWLIQIDAQRDNLWLHQSRRVMPKNVRAEFKNASSVRITYPERSVIIDRQKEKQMER